MFSPVLSSESELFLEIIPEHKTIAGNTTSICLVTDAPDCEHKEGFNSLIVRLKLSQVFLKPNVNHD